MTKKRRTERDLDEISRDLKILLALPRLSASQSAQLFVAATGLLCELNSDKELILLQARYVIPRNPEIARILIRTSLPGPAAKV